MLINKENLKYGLEELSSRKLQEERWLGLVPGVQSSFEEASCWVYDHSNIDITLLDEEFLYLYGPDVLEYIVDLHNLLKKVDVMNLGVRELIESELMDSIRAVAVHLLNSMLFIKVTK